MPALLAAASASKSMRALGTDSDLVAAVAAAVDKCAATAGHAEAAERRARRVPSSGASASDRPTRTHVGCMLLCAVLVAALLTPAASAVPARGAQRRARRAAALAAAQLSSGYGMQSSQLKPFGRCEHSHNGVLEWATFCLACGLEAGTIVMFNECCEADKFADTVQFCRDYTPAQYHPHASHFQLLQSAQSQPKQQQSPQPKQQKRRGSGRSA